MQDPFYTGRAWGGNQFLQQAGEVLGVLLLHGEEALEHADSLDVN